MSKKAQRVTALVGAGAALEIVPKDSGITIPSTANITKEVLKKYNTVNGAGTVVIDIYKHLCKNRILSPLPLFSDESYRIMHFEVIFQIMEILHSYDKVWFFDSTPYDGKGKIEHFRYDLFPEIAGFVKSTFRHDPKELNQCLEEYIRRIMNIVNQYDDYFRTHINSPECRWYKNFWSTRKLKWDVFNLNYDTTIEQCIPYEDGFVMLPASDIRRMDMKRLMDNKSQKSTINHIHGCIVYGNDDLSTEEYREKIMGKYDVTDFFKYKDYVSTPKHWWSDDVAQNRHSHVPVPLITGLDKTDKIVGLPFSAYRQNFEKQILENNALLIVGYSYGDAYINSMLERMRQIHGDKQRIVLIDYWGDVVSKYNEGVKEEVKYWRTHGHHKRSTEELRIDYLKSLIKDAIGFNQGLNEHEGTLITNTIMDHVENINVEFDMNSANGPLVSKNKQLMIFFRGFKDAAKHRKEIYAFLNS